MVDYKPDEFNLMTDSEPSINDAKVSYILMGSAKAKEFSDAVRSLKRQYPTMVSDDMMKPWLGKPLLGEVDGSDLLLLVQREKELITELKAANDNLAKSSNGKALVISRQIDVLKKQLLQQIEFRQVILTFIYIIYLHITNTRIVLYNRINLRVKSDNYCVQRIIWKLQYVSETRAV